MTRILLLMMLSGVWLSPIQAQETPPADKPPADNLKFAIAIHGGAGSSAKNASAASIAKRKATLKAALEKGVGILKAGGSSLDAVENVILILENDPQFNAGKGAVFNAAGSHELDASIMDGSNGACGAVAGVSHVKNPISLARLVMTQTPHVLLSGPGAEAFAKQQKVHWVEPNYFDTPKAKASFERFRLRLQSKSETQPAAGKQEGTSQSALDVLRNRGSSDSSFERQWNIGTVGCVALDAQGNLAAGTSTGGLTYKQFGRIGDSPVVGAGTYADNATCAVSSTGIGEQYIRNVVAYDIAAQLKYKGVSLQEAVDNNLTERLNSGDGGLIAVDKDGNIVMGFNTGGMARAAADSSGRFDVIWGTPDKPAAKPAPKQATPQADPATATPPATEQDQDKQPPNDAGKAEQLGWVTPSWQPVSDAAPLPAVAPLRRTREVVLRTVSLVRMLNPAYRAGRTPCREFVNLQ